MDIMVFELSKQPSEIKDNGNKVRGGHGGIGVMSEGIGIY